MIVAEKSYELSDPTVDSQMVTQPLWLRSRHQ
jgi:hypothetical protein